MPERVLVTGAGGFIGHHLVTYLKERGYWVRGVDLKVPEYTPIDADEFEVLDLRLWESCQKATEGGIDQVFALAADMGGMGFISAHHAEILHNNSLINLHTLEAARQAGVKRYLYSSSACIYPEYLQTDADVKPLREEDAYPAQPQDAYGWEKLVTEKLCEYYSHDYGIETRIVRFHNIFGPNGTYDGGREKAPAALCRKIALAPADGEIEIWGDGEQTRSFCYIDDCVEGIYRLMQSDHREPLNLGRDEMVSINELARIIMEIAGKPDITIRHIDGPQGVRGRNSDNTRLRQVLGWEPRIDLHEGLAPTYRWIEAQVATPTAVAPGPVIERIDVLGVHVSAIDPPMALAEIGRWIAEGERHYVCVTGVHGVMECQRDPELREIHNRSGLTTPDGMPMVWAGRRAGATWMKRVYGPDLMLAVLERGVTEGWSSFFYGGKEGIPEQLAARLTERFPGLRVAGTWSPPFRALTPEEDEALVERMNASGADLVWVGLSTPKQERWMAAHVGRLTAPVLLGVGAAFDMHAGTLRQAPPWMQRHGLEWAYRLYREPRRLWRRYGSIIPRFMVAIVRRPPKRLGAERDPGAADRDPRA